MDAADKRAETAAARDVRIDARLDLPLGHRRGAAIRAQCRAAGVPRPQARSGPAGGGAGGRRAPGSVTGSPSRHGGGRCPNRSGVRPGARRVQVPRVRGSVPGIARRHPLAHGELSAVFRGRVRRARRRLRPRGVPRAARRCRHLRTRDRSQSRDGRDLPRPRTRRRGGRRRRIPRLAPRRFARAGSSPRRWSSTSSPRISSPFSSSPSTSSVPDARSCSKR